MTQFVMALDQGTTSSRTVLFNQRGERIASAGRPFPSFFPRSGWVEQDPEEIWQSQKSTMESVLKQAGLEMKDMSAIGIANQRETVVGWDVETGEPVGKAIVWQCRRTSDYCNELTSTGFGQVIRQRTGLLPDPYFSGTKMRWILQNNSAARELSDQGRLKFGTIDSWLIWNLTKGAIHVTDVSNASRTLLYDIFDGRWNEDILRRFEIPKETLPEVRASSGIVGYTDPGTWKSSVPIAGIAGDQQAALFGQACFKEGMAKHTYGTGCFLLLNTGAHAVKSENDLLTTIAWKIGDRVTYALEGSVFIGGALIQWLRDQLGLIAQAADSEAVARSVKDTGGLYVVPAFVGLGAPHWDAHARGLIIGITRDTDRRHIVRAALEAIAYQSHDVLKALEQDTQISLRVLRVDGGAAANDFLCQFQSDLLGLEISRPGILETTAMGAAFLAGLATGIWKDTDHIQSLWHEERRFRPQRKRARMDSLLKGWNRAVERSKAWARP